MWSELLPVLAAAGYRVLAPDQRGYSPGARPGSAGDYQLAELVADVEALADALGFERFHLVGHDWGSAVGWALAGQSPQRLLSWTALSLPHLDAFAEAVNNDPDQQSRSGYMLFFQAPIIPELLLRWLLRSAESVRDMYDPSLPQAHLEEYVAVLAESGAMSAALNWYRASGLSAPPVSLGDIKTPTLLLWGSQDIAIGRSSVDATAAHMQGPYRLLILEAGHWLMQEATEPVITAILGHLRANDRAASMPPGVSPSP